MISRYENPDYGRYLISTLLDLAAAFDVALVVHFAPFSELVEWDLKATSKTLCPAPYAKDKALGTLYICFRRNQIGRARGNWR